MNKKKRHLMLLILATAAVGVLLWVLAGGQETDADEHDHDHSVSESDHDHGHSGVLLNYSADELKTVTFTNQNAKYTAYLDSKSGSVVFKELKDYSVNSNFMETIWYGAVQMIYQDIAATTDDENYNPKDYGLDKPSLTVKVTFKNGKSYTFKAGKSTPGYDEDVYYLTLSGDRNVYICTLDNAFFMGNVSMGAFASDYIKRTIDRIDRVGRETTENEISEINEALSFIGNDLILRKLEQMLSNKAHGSLLSRKEYLEKELQRVKKAIEEQQ